MFYSWICLIVVILVTQVTSFMNILRPIPGCGTGGPCPGQPPCGQGQCQSGPWGRPPCTQGGCQQVPWMQPQVPPSNGKPYGSHYKVVATLTPAPVNTQSPIGVDTRPKCTADGQGVCSLICPLADTNFTQESFDYQCGISGDKCCRI